MNLWKFIITGALLCSIASGAEKPGMLNWEELPALPNALGVAAPFTGLSGDALLVAGGANFPEPIWESQKVFCDAVYVLEKNASEAGFSWSEAGKLTAPIAYGMSVSYNGSLICMGGCDDNSLTAAVFSLTWNPASSSLNREELPSLPQPCAFGQAAILDNVIYVAGGQKGKTIESAMSNFWRLDLSQRGRESFQWQILAPWPGAALAFPVMAVQNTGKDRCVYLFGGRNCIDGKVVFLKGCYEFNPRLYQSGLYNAETGNYQLDRRGLSAWRVLPDMPFGMAAGTACAVGQAHIFVFGGDDGALFTRADELRDHHPGFPKRTFAYHTITESWIDAGASPVNQVSTQAVPWDDRIAIPSGEIRPRVRTARISSVTLRVRDVSFGWLNYATVAIYLAAMVGIGLWFSRKNKSTDDFFRGGQNLPWWAAGCSIFATMLSSITFMALPALAFKTDCTTWVMNWMIPLMALFVIWKVLPFFRQIDATSAYEYLEKRFGYTARVVGSLMFILFQVGRMGVVMYLPSLALQAVTGLNPITCIVMMGVISILYSAMGGIEAVIWTDTIQTFVLIGSALLSVILIVLSIDGGFTTFFSTACEYHKFHMFDWDFSATSYMAPTIWVIVLGGLAQNLANYTSDQSVIQRYMTTNTEKNAAKAIMTNGLMSAPVSFLFFLLGTALFVYYKVNPMELDPSFKADAVFPLFIATRMPPVAAGLVVAGVFAAAQSTLSTSMNSMATTIITDFAKPFNLFQGDRAYLSFARLLTVGLGAVGTATAILFVTADLFDIFSTYITILGMFMGVLCGMFMLGMFTERTTSSGCLGGATLTACFMIWLSFQSGWNVHGYLYPAISISLCMISGYLLSFLGGSRRRPLNGLTVYTMDGSET